MKANRALSRFLVPCLSPLALAACVAPTAPPPPPPPAPAAPAPRPVVVAPPPADWRDAAQTAGTWRWRMEGDRSLAEYGPYGASPVARLTCDPIAGATILWRNWPATGPLPITVTTTGARRMMTASPDGAGGVAVSMAANDRLLDAVAFTRGRFMLEMPGAPTLYLPAWPELSRVIEDCRQKLERGPGASPEAGPKP